MLKRSYYDYYYYDDYEEAAEFATAALIGWIIGILIVAVICGVITKKINENKGYYGGFWWGFFLGVIGIIVVALKQDIRQNYMPDEYTMRMQNYAQEKYDNVKLSSGGWTCAKCGSVNPKYLTTCQCGMYKGENNNYAEQIKSQEKVKKDAENTEIILRFKKLLDEGIITQEEFEEKKRQLLQ